MNTTAFHLTAHQDEPLLLEDCAPEELADCLAPLAYENRPALWEYWDRVIREEAVPLSERVERVPSFAELDYRRAQRRIHRQSAAAVERAPQDGKTDTGPDAA
jgi:hypothetical protein